MATYTTQAAFEDYVEGWTTDDPAGLERLLQRAERDIDALLGARVPLSTTGLKLDPSTLLDWEAAALSNAVCAQAEHRYTVGEAALRGQTGPAIKSVKGPDFEKVFAVDSSATPYYGPKVRSEMAPIGHLRVLGARAAVG